MAERTITILSPGTFSTVQDLGRPGLARLGIPPGGACDTRSHVIGNRLVGNPDNAASVEMTLSGATVRFDSDAEFVVAGADAAMIMHTPDVAARIVIRWHMHRASAGDVLTIGSISNGARVYLCIAGGVDVPVVMESRSTLAPAAFGGHMGRTLSAGDVLPIGAHEARVARAERPDPEPALAAPSIGAPIRVVLADNFSGRADQDILATSPWSVHNSFSRAGIRLNGGGIGACEQPDMTSRAMMPGMIQRTPSGELIILGPEGPTIGGYPVIACVARVDLPSVGQIRPRDSVRFEPVSRSDARELARDEACRLDTLIPGHA